MLCLRCVCCWCVLCICVYVSARLPLLRRKHLKMLLTQATRQHCAVCDLLDGAVETANNTFSLLSQSATAPRPDARAVSMDMFVSM